MKKIALILCVYNKKDDALKCIESIYESTVSDFDLIVVDNASEDNSGEEIQKRFKKAIMLVNKTNKGSSGGFNTGLKYAAENGYHYAMTLDHDIVVMPDTIEILYGFLESNHDVGVAGAKFCYMDNPSIIQMAGNIFDREKLAFRTVYSQTEDSGKLPDVVYTDAFIAGAAMYRVSLLPSVGLFNEAYFTYIDDNELGLRFNRKGYKVAVCMRSKVLHKQNQHEYSKKNMMPSYYIKRNTVHVVASYCEPDKIERYCGNISSDIFQTIYMCTYLKKINALKTAIFAYDDALNNNLGIADTDKILPADDVPDRFKTLLSDKKHVLIIDSSNGYGQSSKKNKHWINLIKKIWESAEWIKIVIQTDDKGLEKLLKDNKIIDSEQDNSVIITEKPDKQPFDVSFKLCEHILKVKQFNNDTIYVDQFLNLAITDADKEYCLRFDLEYENFYAYAYPLIKQKVNALREKSVKSIGEDTYNVEK